MLGIVDLRISVLVYPNIDLFCENLQCILLFHSSVFNIYKSIRGD